MSHINIDDFEISEFRDGAVSLTCGKDGMESDLVFAAGAMTGDPLLEKQRETLEFILMCIKHWEAQ